MRCGAGFSGPWYSVWRVDYSSFELGLNILGPSFVQLFFVNKIILMYNGKGLSMVEYRSIE